jgi:hypothetical protein
VDAQPRPLGHYRLQERLEFVGQTGEALRGSSLMRRSNRQPISITACRAPRMAACAAAKRSAAK